MIKNLLSKNTLKRPVGIILLPVFIVSLLFVALILAYTPENSKLDEQIAQLKQDLAKTDQKLLQRRQFEKAISRYNGLEDLGVSLGHINGSFNNLLTLILDLENAKNRIALIEKTERSMLVITIHTKDSGRLYPLIENIESAPSIDRITLNETHNNKVILSLFLSNNAGGVE